MTDQPFLFLTGGARSGKSDLALRRARAAGRPVTFIAPAVATDADMVARIERHRAERPDHWLTIEAPIEIGRAVGEADGAEPATTIVIDCLTVWTANLLLADRSEDDIVSEATAVADLLVARAAPSIVVSNEVGLGVHPPTELGRRYRDVLGLVNRAVAQRADRALLCVAGLVVDLHHPDRLLDG